MAIACVDVTLGDHDMLACTLDWLACNRVCQLAHHFGMQIFGPVQVILKWSDIDEVGSIMGRAALSLG